MNMVLGTYFQVLMRQEDTRTIEPLRFENRPARNDGRGSPDDCLFKGYRDFLNCAGELVVTFRIVLCHRGRFVYTHIRGLIGRK